PMPLRDFAKWQIHLFVPAFLFDRVMGTDLSWSAMSRIVVAILSIKAILGVLVYGFLRWRSVPQRTLAPVLLATVVFNAGNFGIPVAERAFGHAGGAVEALVVMASNLSLWGIGYALSSAINGGGWSGVLAYFRLPMVYVLAIALLLRGAGIRLPEPIAYAAHGLAEALVPLALITLGAQLASQGRRPNWRLVGPVVVVKLLAMPAVAAIVVVALGLWPWPGAQLIVAAAGPTAVNTLLLAMEQDADVELSADCVFWSTVFAAATVTIVLALVRHQGGVPPLPATGP
ncbi:MAG: AEC family transporter, partial [Armatimonadota bacterium]